MSKFETQIPRCPKCDDVQSQHKKGFTSVKSQRWFCNVCKHKYTPNPKKWAYSEDERKEAMRILLDGNSGRAVGRMKKMSKANAYRWSREEAKKGTT